MYELHPASAPNQAVTVVGQESGPNVELATDRNLASQRWRLVRQANGYYQVLPTSNEGQCLDVRKRSVAEGANVQTWQCNPRGQPNQEWKISREDATKESYRLSPRHADERGMNRRLAASGISSSSETNLLLAVGNGRETQLFVLERVTESGARTVAPSQTEATLASGG